MITFTYPALLVLLPLFALVAALGLLGPALLRARGPWRTRLRALPASRWAGAALRLLIGWALILALAGVQWQRPVRELSVVFVLDLSDSVPESEQARAEAFIRQAVATMPAHARAAIVAFGEDALVERLASSQRDLPPIASVPRTQRTNIGAAIRLALALFPEGTQKRMVILSDGLENVGDARRQAELAAVRGVEIAVVPLTAPPAEQEAYVEALSAPAAVRKGQAFDVTATVMSSVAQEATLRLFGDGRLLQTKSVSLQAGVNRILLSLTAEETGFRRYRVELDAPLDSLPQNNLASGFTMVYGPPRVLIAALDAAEVDALRTALESTGVEVTVLPPQALPTDPTTLASYDSILLANVPAESLPKGTMEALPVVVRELGRGLVMVGGDASFGAGNYLRTPVEAALPVDMEVRSRTREANIALVMVIDKSGSMGRCHCNNPNAKPGEYDRVETGLPKVDIAKDAVLQATQALGRNDYLGVVAFNENALWALPLQRLPDTLVIQQAIGGIQAEGQTNIYAGLAEAEKALLEVDARVKHMILLTDGWSTSGQYDALTKRLAEEGITLSVVAAGGGSAEYLETLAENGGGRYYPAPSMQDVPQIFLKETVQAVGEYIIEEPFYPLPAAPSPILRGFDAASLPPLFGYNGATPKQTAQVVLLSQRGDPVLAQWQYGLGRAVAWTSDLKPQWAVDWVTWERFNVFAAQLVNWTLPAPFDENLSVEARSDGAEVRFVVDATDEQGRPRDLLQTTATLVGPDFVTTTVTLEQTGAGHYEGLTLLGEPGTYLVQVVQRDAQGNPVAQRTTGLVVPYSPEYKRLGSGEGLLRALAQLTGGKELAGAEEVFLPTAQPARRAVPLWPALLLMAALLFPVDVGLRRLRLQPSDWARLRRWADEHLRLRSRRSRRRGEPEVLSDLFRARERARQRRARPVEGRPVELPPAEAKPPAAPPPPPKPPAAPASEEDALARLRQARERARKR